VLRRDLGDVVDQEAVTRLRGDVGDGVADVHDDEAQACVGEQHRREVGDRVEAPRDQQHEAQGAQRALDGWVLCSDLRRELTEQRGEDQDEEDHRERPEDPLGRGGVGDLAGVAQHDHEERVRDELVQQRATTLRSDREHQHELGEEQRDGDDPVDVAVRLVEAGAFCDGLLEGLHDAEVVVPGDRDDDTRDGDRHAVGRGYIRPTYEEEDGATQEDGEGEREEPSYQRDLSCAQSEFCDVRHQYLSPAGGAPSAPLHLVRLGAWRPSRLSRRRPGEHDSWTAVGPGRMNEREPSAPLTRTAPSGGHAVAHAARGSGSRDRGPSRHR